MKKLRLVLEILAVFVITCIALFTIEWLGSH
jgi:hypothetical protein